VFLMAQLVWKLVQMIMIITGEIYIIYVYLTICVNDARHFHDFFVVL